MSRIKNPLLSLDARNTLGKVVTFVKRRKQNIAEKTPVIPDARTLAQLSWRHMYQKAVALWHALSAAEKQDWESQARSRHMTGFAWFMSQALKPNPGLYLPLQGGSMTGDIEMNKNRILELPLPTDGQEAATINYCAPFKDNQGRFYLLFMGYSAIGQGVWNASVNPLQCFNIFFGNSAAAADGDNISYDVYFDAGTYTLGTLGTTNLERAIQDVDINGTEIASFDWYSGALVYNIWKAQTGIVIPTSGRYTLKVRVDGRNPLSNNWRFYGCFMVFWRTA